MCIRCFAYFAYFRADYYRGALQPATSQSSLFFALSESLYVCWMYTGTAGFPLSRLVPWDQAELDRRNEGERMPIELMTNQMYLNYMYFALDAPLFGVIVFALIYCS